jgi:hypothetical protein
MSIHIKKDADHGFVDIEVSGSITEEVAQQARVECVKLLQDMPRPLVLVDISRGVSRLSISEIYDVPEKWNTTGLPRNMRLALVAPPHSISLENARFYENVARNRGWIVQVLADRDSAIQWLTTD